MSITAVAVCLAVLVACDGTATDPTPSGLIAISVDPPTLLLDALGDTVRLSAGGTYGPQESPTPVSPTWKSLDRDVVDVDATGLVSSVSPGVGRIVATVGALADTVSVEVRQLAIDLELVDESLTLDALGAKATLGFVGSDRNGHALPPDQVEWHSSDPAIIFVSDVGQVSAISEGTVDVEITSGLDLSDRVTIVVRQRVASLALPAVPNPLTFAGDTVRLIPKAFDANDHLVQLFEGSWHSSDSTVATVDGSGRVTAASGGVSSIAFSIDEGPSDTTAVSVDFTFQQDIYGIPESIDGTGTDDVTDELNAFFQSVPDHSIIEFPEGVEYRVEGTLLFEDRNGLTLDGNGATVFAETDGSGVVADLRRRVHVWVEGGSNFVVRGLTIRGAHPSGGTGASAYVARYEAQHGLEFAGVQGVLVEGVTVTDVYGDFLYLGRSTERVWTQDVVVRDCHFERNGRQGIAITAARQILVEDCYIGDVRRASVDLEPNTESGGAVDVTFRDNTFGPGRLMWVASKGRGSDVRFIRFLNNVLDGRPIAVAVKPPDGERRGPFEFVGNVSNRGAGNPQETTMEFFAIDGLTIRDNHQPMNPGRNMSIVSVWESCDVAVDGNTGTNLAIEARIEPFSGCAAGEE